MPQSSIVQLQGGIHRYLEAYKEDGGICGGANYTFDKRFSHGADNAVIISKCSARYGIELYPFLYTRFRILFLTGPLTCIIKNLLGNATRARMYALLVEWKF